MAKGGPSLLPRQRAKLSEKRKKSKTPGPGIRRSGPFIRTLNKKEKRVNRMGKKVRLTPKKGKEDDEIGKLWATGTSR